jgi:hypothetical protein
VKNYKKSEITKTAQLDNDTWAQEEAARWVMNDYTLYKTVMSMVSSGADSTEIAAELQRLLSAPVNMEVTNLSPEDIASIDWESLAEEVMSYMEDDVDSFDDPEEF